MPTGLLKSRTPDASRPEVHWSGLHASATALAIAEAAAREDRPWIIVEADSRSAERRRAELGFFAPASLPLLSLPDW